MKEIINIDPDQRTFGFGETPLRGDGRGNLSGGQASGANPSVNNSQVPSNAKNSPLATEEPSSKTKNAADAVTANKTRRIKAKKTCPKKTPKDTTKNDADKSLIKRDVVADTLVTDALKNVLVPPPINFAARLPAGLVLPKNLDVASMDRYLAEIADPVMKMRVEGCWLDMLEAQLDCGLRLIGLRRGIALLAIKAETKVGDYEAAAKLFYPNFSERTMRDWMGKARILLGEAESNFSLNEAENDYAAFRQKWSITKIMEFERRKAETLLLQQSANGGAREGLDKKLNQPEKIERSPFVRIETFSTHLRRSAKSFLKALTSAKRVNPDDFSKAISLVERHLPDDLQPSVKKIIESRQTAADQAETKTEASA